MDDEGQSKDPIPMGPEDDPRTQQGRDYARVLHSGAFRRLQAKTQVVHVGHADWFRTRLTHTLEVAQIARDTARRVIIQGPPDDATFDGPTLVETAALIHDLGHPPFGHNGEVALKDWTASVGSSFEANAQSLRIVDALEIKVEGADSRSGLGLSPETIAASLKYPWPKGSNPDTKDFTKFGYYESDWPYENDAVTARRALALLSPVPSVSDR